MRAISSTLLNWRKLDVLREHCTAEGRDYAEIEKTVQTRFDLGEHAERVD